MDCKRVEQLLPLHAGGDIADGRERARLAAHLEGCAACRRLAGEWAESMSLLRLEQPPEFDAAFFDPIRRNVMREITAQAKPARPALAALLAQLLWPKTLAYASLALACAALLVALRLSRPPQPSKTVNVGVAGSLNRPLSFGPETPKESPHVAVAHEDGPRKTGGRALRAHKDRPAPRGRALAKKTAARAEDGGPAAPVLLDANAELAVVKDEREMLKIDLRTSDPDVRIIWFSPRPDEGSSPRSTNDKR